MAAEALLVLAAVFMSITVLFVAMRLFTRLVFMKNMGPDDYLICVAVIFAIVCSSTPIAAIKYGLGSPIKDQTPGEVAPYQKLTLTSSVSYSFSALFIKLSLLTFYTRLSPERSFLIMVYVAMFIVTGFGIGSIVAVLVQCIPLSMLWNPNQEGHCFHIINFYYANAALNIITDVGILLLPMKLLWGLHMPIRQRISLCGLFGLGSLVCVASVVRLATLKSIIHSTDATRDLVSPLTWSIVELHTAIFIACAPAFKAFLRRYVPTLLGSSYNVSGPTKYGSKSRQTKQNSVPLGSISHNKSGTGTGLGSKWANNGTTSVRATGPEDNESQEHIYQSYHGILQEVTVTVASERRSQDEASSRRSIDKADF
ncbi:uncharacterized protein BDZ99DRAFT_467286 [Mytilinidion resinicola]|uniref:Rhodopsin domain-containing protein n=1 Tax=Mytilinidion resinicola TaxID=574789 RepID=A0A6A6Y9E8_9PEZI|nr:uncharacterized protein BDZ99DRAFT_467286 [Mytilinidion resinicola]KAF2804604.1 hypothetical protein BDZ99DRAFT_467286 [Mytilinidion resinicola]